MLLITLTVSSTLVDETLILSSEITAYDTTHEGILHYTVNILRSQATTPGDLPTLRGGPTSKGLTNTIVSDSNISVFHTHELALKENMESVTFSNVFNQCHFIKEE